MDSKRNRKSKESKEAYLAKLEQLERFRGRSFVAPSEWRLSCSNLDSIIGISAGEKRGVKIAICSSVATVSASLPVAVMTDDVTSLAATGTTLIGFIVGIPFSFVYAACKPGRKDRKLALDLDLDRIIVFENFPPLLQEIVDRRFCPPTPRAYTLMAQLAEAKDKEWEALSHTYGPELKELCLILLQHSDQDTKNRATNILTLLDANGPKMVAGSNHRAAWAEARDLHSRVNTAWADLLLDPLSVLELPALLDVQVPTTSAFVQAHTDADDLLRVNGERYPGDVDAVAYVRAVSHVERCWNEARAYAEHVQDQVVPEEERDVLATAVKLASLAKNGAETAERALAAQRLNSVLWGLTTLRLHSVSLAAINAQARGELTTGKTSI